MTILFLGDIIGRPGRRAVKKILPRFKKAYDPDLVIANCENLAHGKGLTENTLKEMRDVGIDFFTSGNHIFDRKQGRDLLGRKNINVLRPANYPPGVPGRGFQIIEVGTKKVGIVNLVGRVFFREDFDCPFRKADKILKEWKKKKLAAIIVDFHVEASSEASALGWYLDGRVSAVLGTHGHVQSADERILSQGTAYITDVGMVGAEDSVIGFGKDLVLKTFLTQMPITFEIGEGNILVNAAVVEVDSKTARAGRIERIREVVEE